MNLSDRDVPDRQSEPDHPGSTEAPDTEGDFASEHESLTVADRRRDGPEGTPERESPEGLGVDP